MNDKIMYGEDLDLIMDKLICCAAVFRVLQADLADDRDRRNCINALAGAVDHLDSVINDFRVDILASPDYEDVEAEDGEPAAAIPPDGTGNVWGSQRVSDEDGSEAEAGTA